MSLQTATATMAKLPNVNPPRADLSSFPTWLHYFFVVLVMAVTFGVALVSEVPVPDGDAPRYINYALNWFVHGIGSSQTFDRENIPEASLLYGGPLTTLEISIAMLLDPNTLSGLQCFVKGDDCNINILGLRLIHVLEILVFLGCLWGTARILFNNDWASWLTTLIALACKDIFFGINMVLTEPLHLANIGLTILIRPENPNF